MKKFTNFVGLDVHKETIAVITGSWLKDPADPQWADDQAVQAYRAFMKKYYPEGDPVDVFNVNGYSMSQAITEVLRRCKDDLTRENVLRQATNLKDVELPMLLPGLKLNTSPQDYQPVKYVQPARFDGARLVRFGELAGQ